MKGNESTLVFVLGLALVFAGLAMVDLPRALQVVGGILILVTTIPRFVGKQ